ncbi:MAG TPA: hypothetical protein VFA70_06395 [Dehalococcoidia bacterium]|jgi:hypothetical protein|nr:hypothetical protein [Dehalococcoidia bacterium]
MYETIRADARLLEHELEAARYAAASRTPRERRASWFSRLGAGPRSTHRVTQAARPSVNVFTVAQAIFRAS